jgi:hypothetical protein
MQAMHKRIWAENLDGIASTEANAKDKGTLRIHTTCMEGTLADVSGSNSQSPHDRTRG